MLETTLQTNFTPGTNLTGGLASAAWRFLLPSLQLETIVCLEVPGKATLRVLAQHCRQLIVLSARAQKLQRRQQEITPQNGCAWDWRLLPDFNRLPLATTSIDLLVLAGGSGLALISQHAALVPEMKRALKPEGTVYFETKTLRQRFTAGRLVTRLQQLGFGAPRVFWVTPFRGELRTAFPLGDERMSQYLLRTVLFGQSLQKRVASRVGSWLSRSGFLSLCAPRRAIVLPHASTSQTVQVPPYVAAIARAAGMDLDGHRCGLSARGKYNSNKTIFYLFGAASAHADLVVKMARAPEFNARLENEHRVLALLEQKKLVARDSYPRALFFGHHAGLALMGQQAVHGAPFRRRTTAAAQCPFARQALAWFADLAGEEAQRESVSGAEAGARLFELLQRFAALYALTAAEREFLDGQIALIQQSSARFPLVFQHGDAGTWNMLVSAEGKVIVIDWEAGEPRGMPLWDMFYFMRSFGNWCARAKGVRDPLTSFRKNFCEPSDIGAVLLQTVSQYCAALGLERRLVSPLLLTCWMQRALKESARLTPAQLQHGHYYNLLKLCIAQHQAPALQALWS